MREEKVRLSKLLWLLAAIAFCMWLTQAYKGEEGGFHREAWKIDTMRKGEVTEQDGNEREADETCATSGRLVSPEHKGRDICRIVNELRKSEDQEGLQDGYTLVVTTYKGYLTLRHTVGWWRRSGFLAHPALKEVLLHVNRCTCNDSATIQRLFREAVGEKVQVRLLCTPRNRLHPQALLSGVLEARTRFVLFSENDRPTLQRSNESPEELRARVRSVLDASLEVAGDPATPFVLLHRFYFGVNDEALYDRWEETGGQQPIELTRPHQHPGDATPCLQHCYAISKAWHNETTRAEAEKRCAQDASTLPLCEYYVCREWSLWHSENGTTGEAGAADDPLHRDLMCHQTWLRDPGPPEWYRREILVKLRRDPFISCTRSAHFVNAPALYSRSWYLNEVAGRMCASRSAYIESGVGYIEKKKIFGHYGRKMERFLIKHLAGNVVCHGDGITEHVELENYDTDAIKGKPQDTNRSGPQ